MTSGPQNFLSRVNQELTKFDLPKHAIINPNLNDLSVLEQEDILKIGRLDGVIYYKMTSRNLYNLILQRRSKKISFINYIPNFITMLCNDSVNKYLNRTNRTIMQKCDAIIFQSELSRKMHSKFIGITEKPSKIILNGVPTDKFCPQMPSLQMDGYPKLVITASFRLHKRLQDAIFIINNLKQKYSNIKLHVIGDIDYLTKKHIRKLNISNCIFHGRVASEDLPKFYSSCDIGLSLCIFDSCPNSVIEMMGCGLPVITNSQSGASELLKHKDLIVLDEFDIDFIEIQTAENLPKVDIIKWSEAIEKVLGNKRLYRDYMLERVEEELDIKIVAKKYAEFIMENQYALN